jgi:beta-lactamase superfamily II metal-dependent hydrolase
MRTLWHLNWKVKSRARRLGAALGSCVLIYVLSSAAVAADHGDLQIYFVDVEGGQATLFVTPANQSLLIDTGWPDNNGRDADRIVAAAKEAGISKIDYVLITHFHVSRRRHSPTDGADSSGDVYRPRSEP